MPKTFSRFLKESEEKVFQIVVYPGRFQPACQHHLQVYEHLKEQFPDCPVYIATSDKVDDKSPLNFEERKQCLEALGIENVICCKQPFRPKEIFETLDNTDISVIFAKCKKDDDIDEMTDGDYFEEYTSLHQCSKPYADRGYIYPVEAFSASVLGQDVQDASEIRSMYHKEDDDGKRQMIEELYGKFDESIYKLFNEKFI